MSLETNTFASRAKPPGPPKPLGLSRRVLILGLAAISLVILAIFLVLVVNTIKDDAGRLETQLETIAESITRVPTPLPEINALVDTLTQLQEAAVEIQAARSNIPAGYTDWRLAMLAIGAYNPDQLDLTSLTQNGAQITLEGWAVNDSIVAAYAQSLKDTDLFAQVVVQSIQVIATPIPTPTSAEITPTETPLTTTLTTPSPTPTIDHQLDVYEVDDFEPTDIFMGDPQLHNFHPVYDVDTVKFLAKAGRYYRVYTTDLSPGVDTFLTAILNDVTYTNDDFQAGTLSSQIDFPVASDYDVEVTVKITNRGQYGPDKWYQVIVEEVVITPTPIPTAPTDTPTPENTPTSTPDPRDQYEPDDTPKPIAVGETQTRNFYPDNDVDRVSFVAKAGHDYRVHTSNLALGVDTHLAVTLGQEEWENDDYAPPGAGNFASAVCFQAPADGTAVATISNLQQLYGADKSYQISVSEAPSLSVNPLTLDFGSAEQGGVNPAAQQVNIASAGGAELTWTAETSDAWLSLIPASGFTPNTNTLSVSVDINGLVEGDYLGSIVISGTALCTQNTPQTVTVSLQVTASSARAAGLASMAPHSAKRVRWQPSYPHPAAGRLDSGLVEFVILLELKTESP